MRLAHHDPVKPRGQTGLLPKLPQGTIRFNERLLDHILCCRVVASNQAPCQAPGALAMRCHEQVKALFQFQCHCRGLLYQSLFHHTPCASDGCDYDVGVLLMRRLRRGGSAPPRSSANVLALLTCPGAARPHRLTEAGALLRGEQRPYGEPRVQRLLALFSDEPTDHLGLCQYLGFSRIILLQHGSQVLARFAEFATYGVLRLPPVINGLVDSGTCGVIQVQRIDFLLEMRHAVRAVPRCSGPGGCGETEYARERQDRKHERQTIRTFHLYFSFSMRVVK